MNIFRLLPNALALSLTTALLTPQILPAQAQLTKRPGILPKLDGFVEFIHTGSYIIDYNLTYNLNGTPQAVNRTNVPVGHRQRHVIPANATNIHVQIQFVNGCGTLKFCRFPFPSFGNNVGKAPIAHPNGSTTCFATFGNIIAGPKINNDCR